MNNNKFCYHDLGSWYEQNIEKLNQQIFEKMLTKFVSIPHQTNLVFQKHLQIILLYYIITFFIIIIINSNKTFSKYANQIG